MTSAPEPAWIRADVVRAIQLRQIAEHGGLAGIRDEGLLASALARPRNLHHYSDPKPDVAALAASYAFGIVKNHAFLDGNKRTGFVVARTFLLLNGQDIRATQEEKYIIFLKLAEGGLSEEELAVWIRGKLIEANPGGP